MSFVPLHKTASQSFHVLQSWIASWAPWELEFLESEGWYERGHDISGGYYYSKGIWYPQRKFDIFVWEPAPAAASTAFEELRKV
eukprot:11081008-Ditylum_brightwellii.AAC.1